MVGRNWNGLFLVLQIVILLTGCYSKQALDISREVAETAEIGGTAAVGRLELQLVETQAQLNEAQTLLYKMEQQALDATVLTPADAAENRDRYWMQIIEQRDIAASESSKGQSNAQEAREWFKAIPALQKMNEDQLRMQQQTARAAAEALVTTSVGIAVQAINRPVDELKPESSPPAAPGESAPEPKPEAPPTVMKRTR